MLAVAPPRCVQGLELVAEVDEVEGVMAVLKFVLVALRPEAHEREAVATLGLILNFRSCECGVCAEVRL